MIKKHVSRRRALNAFTLTVKFLFQPTCVLQDRENLEFGIENLFNMTKKMLFSISGTRKVFVSI